MILLLNSDNFLGNAIAAELLRQHKKFFRISNDIFINNLTVSYDDSGAFWEVDGDKVYIKEFTAVYCGYYSNNDSPALCKNGYESYYLASCWEAYLQYVLVKIPLKIGVIKHEFSLGNFLQLPVFYKIINGFGLKSPSYIYRCHQTEAINDLGKGDYYFCNKLYCEDICSFKKLLDSSALIIEKKLNMWGKILIIADNLYFFTLECGVWVERDLNLSIKNNIKKLLNVFDVTLGKIILRYNSSFKDYVFYGMNLNLSAIEMELLPKDIADVAIRFLSR
tara:strand:+ start:390 stop:1223 length:834 start_codon:yes stop_codon:yes gene_type:complete